jgi:hypothetical protein
MYLQQTKVGSRGSGGPQYYFHDLTDSAKLVLRSKGAVQLALVTPYGATPSNFFAVGKDHKFDSRGRIVAGSVGHDRVQQGTATGSIGEAIRLWYRLPVGDFERIDVELADKDDVFYLTPLSYRYAKGRKGNIPRPTSPLSFTHDFISPLWIHQMAAIESRMPGLVAWSLAEICRIVSAHKIGSRLAYLDEKDLLRASGPLKHLGMALGGYVKKGYDCISDFTFLSFPRYTVPVEIKKTSKGFKYQQDKYGKDTLSRAVILCVKHDNKRYPDALGIDVIELEAMCNYASMYPVQAQ